MPTSILQDDNMLVLCLQLVALPNKCVNACLNKFTMKCSEFATTDGHDIYLWYRSIISVTVSMFWKIENIIKRMRIYSGRKYCKLPGVEKAMSTTDFAEFIS